MPDERTDDDIRADIVEGAATSPAATGRTTMSERTVIYKFNPAAVKRLRAAVERATNGAELKIVTIGSSVRHDVPIFLTDMVDWVAEQQAQEPEGPTT